MGRNSSRNPFAGKQRLGGSKLPKPPKRKKPAGGGGGGDGGGGKKGQRSFWGLVAVGASLAAFWAGALLQLRRTREQRLTKDRVTLGALLRKPLEFTEHARCRMGCRCACGSARAQPACALVWMRCTCLGRPQRVWEARGLAPAAGRSAVAFAGGLRRCDPLKQKLNDVLGLWEKRR